MVGKYLFCVKIKVCQVAGIRGTQKKPINQ